MKKFNCFLSILLCIISSFGFTACSNNNSNINNDVNNSSTNAESSENTSDDTNSPIINNSNLAYESDVINMFIQYGTFDLNNNYFL